MLVAGVGNVFFGDDGFGPEVARVLLGEPLDGAKVEDFGIRGLHLAYELLNGYEARDPHRRGCRAASGPGTLYRHRAASRGRRVRPPDAQPHWT